MIPKTIHLCWFSKDPYPVEIKVCLDTWKRILPDYTVKLWDEDMARSIGCAFVNEALDARRWAFAADVVRFYALYTEGGIYMDSDIYLLKRFDELIPEHGFATFNEYLDAKGLQAAFLMGEKGNRFCKDMIDYYFSHHYQKEDGTFNNTISPLLMRPIAEKYGYKEKDENQFLGEVTVYPTHLLAPRKKYPIDQETIGVHRVYGSWRKRGLGRRMDLLLHHYYYVVRYFFFHR